MFSTAIRLFCRRLNCALVLLVLFEISAVTDTLYIVLLMNDKQVRYMTIRLKCS